MFGRQRGVIARTGESFIDGRLPVGKGLIVAMLVSCAGREQHEAGLCVLGEADSGESALIEVWRLWPDVVVLDVRLPGIDGFEVATRLTRDGWTGEVLLVSSRPPRPGGTFRSYGRISVQRR